MLLMKMNSEEPPGWANAWSLGHWFNEDCPNHCLM